ncbi:MAG: ATPase, partial [Planktomarina sp.]|nr:ATPase [Planktomarina sp.]
IETGHSPDKINPDDFIRWTYSRALAHRQPRYEQMSNWGLTIKNENLTDLSSSIEFEDFIADELKKNRV